MSELMTPEREERIIQGVINLAHSRTTPEDGSFSLFGELPHDPSIYPGQALSEYYVPAKPVSRDVLMEQGIAFCPNLEEVLSISESDERLWHTFSLLVKEGYRISPETNHRAIPDVAVNQLIQALILSKPQFLGERYFELSSVAIAKPVAFFQYGETSYALPNGDERMRPRSAVEVITMFSGVELVLPGTKTIKGSAYIKEDDRKTVNAPIKKRREQMHKLGGMITSSAPSGSEDLRLVGPNGKTLIIQQPLTHGTAIDMIGEKTLILPTAVAFDKEWTAKLWTGNFTKIKNEKHAHDIMRLIARQAEILSGERTIYVNDHGVLENFANFRGGIAGLSGFALKQYANLMDRFDQNNV